jgi:anti-sigma regulatory factor (Ser/Thr protein kinase)
VATERFGTRLPHAADAPRIARGLLVAWAQAAVEPDQLQTARLLVSELVSNAVVHGEGQITLCVWLRADAVRVEVRDQGAGFALGEQQPSSTRVGGWGLWLVSTQSSRWGLSDDCARVWFELDHDGASCTSERPQSTTSQTQSPEFARASGGS